MNNEKLNQNSEVTPPDETNMPSLLFDIVETLSITACAVLLIFTFICRIAFVDGESMANTLHEGNALLVSDFLYKPERGDIVTFQQINKHNGQKPLVKRIIAVGGETIDIDFDTWTVTIDGEPLNEEEYRYLDPKHKILSDYDYPLTVPEGYVFVMGDNRNGSMDSRDSRVGLVDERFIIGRVIFRFYPIFDISYFGKVSY